MILIFPDPCSLTAIGADIDILTALEDLPTEFDILFIMPDLAERLPLEIA
jgi:hypothetical protein